MWDGCRCMVRLKYTVEAFVLLSQVYSSAWRVNFTQDASQVLPCHGRAVCGGRLAMQDDV